MNRKFIAVMMCVVAVLILIGLPCLAQAAGVATDYQSYAPGDVVEITGFGWQPDESVSLSLYNADDPENPYLWYTFSSSSYADSSGIFTAEYVIQSGDDGHTFLLKAQGQNSGLAQTIFDDAPHLHFFEDASQNIPRDAFAWGTTVYARADDLDSRTCWQIRWIAPSGYPPVATDPLDASAPAHTRNDSFVVPASGPSGIWKAELWRPSNGNPCGDPLQTFSLRYTLYFDVAQIVVIGADDSYITNNPSDFNSNSSLLFKYLLDVNNDSNDTEKTFLHFHIPWLPGDVVSAKVRMRVLLPPSFFNSRTYNINRVTNSWDVNTINWDNQPGVAGAVTNSQPTPTGLSAINSLMRWDVTSDVFGFTLPKDPLHNYGWRIADSAGLDPEGTFYSTEANTLLGSELYGPVLLIDTQPKMLSTVSIPTMTEWGMIIFILLAGLGAVYYLRRQRRAQD